jgi:hypothetical protein
VVGAIMAAAASGTPITITFELAPSSSCNTSPPNAGCGRG